MNEMFENGILNVKLLDRAINFLLECKKNLHRKRIKINRSSNNKILFNDCLKFKTASDVI